VSRSALVAACAAVVAIAGSVIGWQTEAPRAATAAPREVLSGADLFAAKGCATCHTGPDTHAGFDSYPSLASASSWAGERRPGLTAREYLTESIRIPSAFLSPAFHPDGGPTGRMPDLGLSDAEIDALVNYLLDDGPRPQS
jgi:mono/diheme cytochrome c family protein